MGEFFLIVEFQLINVEGIVEIENHQITIWQRSSTNAKIGGQKFDEKEEIYVVI